MSVVYGVKWKYHNTIKDDLAGQVLPPFAAVNASIVTYGNGISVDVFMKKGRQYFLFAKGGEIGEKCRSRCIDNDVGVLYIRSEDKDFYERHVDAVFLEMLQDQRIPSLERSRMLHDYSLEVGMELFRPDGMIRLEAGHRHKVEKLVDGTFEYLSRTKGALGGIVKLLQHNNKTYNHCVNVSLYTLSILVHFKYDRITCRHVGAGANLHDIGKIKVPRDILDKPGRLTSRERLVVNNHPDDGLALTRAMDLDAASRDCVIFHHEKLDGSGYPGGTHSIPEHVRIVTVADIYDALTSDRPYSKRLEPFEAMKIIHKEVESGKLDRSICKEFVKMLSHDGLTV